MNQAEPQSALQPPASGCWLVGAVAATEASGDSAIGRPEPPLSASREGCGARTQDSLLGRTMGRGVEIRISKLTRVSCRPLICQFLGVPCMMTATRQCIDRRRFLHKPRVWAQELCLLQVGLKINKIWGPLLAPIGSIVVGRIPGGDLGG